MPEEFRTKQEPVEIFRMVLRSLEIHRPAKAETDVSNLIRQRWHLSPVKAALDVWPEQLLATGVAVDEFIVFVLDALAPFVEMLLDVYSFLHDYVSTSGGRTEHFAIDSTALKARWNFDVSRLPHQASWVQAWFENRVVQVKADIEHIARNLLLFDNGIFYGLIDRQRLVQSLLVARRDGYLPESVRQLANDIRATLLPILYAACRKYEAENIETACVRERLIAIACVPTMPPLLTRIEPRSFAAQEDCEVGIDLHVVTGNPGYQLADVFVTTSAGSDIGVREGKRNWSLAAIAFFCALWGLDDSSFGRAMANLTAHEDRGDLLTPEEMQHHGMIAAGELLARLKNVIAVEEPGETVKELRKKRIELLLLPYWKHRWFLYEIWILLLPLRRTRQLGGRIELLGVGAIPGKDVVGMSWNLPTQKAKQPVARLSGSTATLEVWFQRETRRLDANKNMEPDIRLTDPAQDIDLMILEVKDRMRFATAGKRVARSYLAGSKARAVWVINYEGAPEQAQLVREEIDGREIGVLNGFRPGIDGGEFDEALSTLLNNALGLKRGYAANQADYRVLIVDTSGSMALKQVSLRNLPMSVNEFLPENVYTWAGAITPISSDDFARLRTGSPLPSGGTEDAGALKRFIGELPPHTHVILITDRDGRRATETIGLRDAEVREI